MQQDQPPGAEPDQTSSQAARARRRSPSSGHVRSFVKELLFVVVGAVLVSSLLRAFVGQMFIIPSGSMENTLLIEDRVVVQKITGFHRGDVVVFEDPGDWLSVPLTQPGPFDHVLEFVGNPTQSATGHLIKRVVGLPGDRVICCDQQGRITVNGHALDEAGYLYTSPDGTPVNPSDAASRWSSHGTASMKPITSPQTEAEEVATPAALTA